MNPARFKRTSPSNDRPHRQPGQILILFALMLPAMMGLVAAAIEVGHIYAAQHSLQEAADLAALAGASQLPGSASQAISLATTNAASNGYSSGVTYTTPYSGANQAIPAAQKIQVTISKSVSLFFGPLLHMDSFTVTASAVAYRPPPGSAGTFVFFANRSGCPSSSPTYGLDLHGGNDKVTGTIHTNGDFRMTGGSYKLNVGTTGQNTYVCTKTTDYGETTDLTKVAAKTMPVTFAYTDFACTFTLSASQPTLAAYTYPAFFNGQVLKDGTYCSTGDISLGWVPSGPKVTFVAKGRVALTGGLSLSPYSKGVLAYTESNGNDGNPAFNTVGGGSVGSGIIYAPNGHAHILGGGFTLAISVYANTIDVLGGGSTFTAASSGGVAPPARLIQ